MGTAISCMVFQKRYIRGGPPESSRVQGFGFSETPKHSATAVVLVHKCRQVSKRH